MYVCMLVRGQCFPENNSVFCYFSLTSIKLNIRFRYMFGTISFKKVRIFNR